MTEIVSLASSASADIFTAARRRIRAALPSMRRFGRALTGNQQLGDLAVLRVMEGLLTSRYEAVELNFGRASFYRLTLHELKALRGQHGVECFETIATPVIRQAQLLMYVEGFSCEEAAFILDVDSSEVSANAAPDTSDAIHSCNVLIIEDEPLISMQLETLVLQLGHRVAGLAVTAKQALKIYQNFTPDLVLSDVHLADGSSGIAAVDMMTSLPQNRVVFITAYPDRLLTGDRKEPVFLITKPFDVDAVKATINQAFFLATVKEHEIA